MRLLLLPLLVRTLLAGWTSTSIAGRWKRRTRTQEPDMITSFAFKVPAAPT